MNVCPLSHLELTNCAEELARLLADVVEAPTMGFAGPLSYDQAYAYWLSLRGQLRAGARMLLIARMRGRIVASGQLALAGAPSARHRAEVQKVFVSRDVRGRGLGKRIMAELHDLARMNGRSLLLLTARCGSPEEFLYRSVGYRSVGVIPGYVMGPTGERYDTLSLYMEI